jgi:AraC-like DNA-binding protein
MHACPSMFAQAPIGRQRHAANQRLERHCHDSAFATVVLGGGYLEAGDEGRRTIGAGDVLIHRAYESHLDCFSHCGAHVLILPVTSAATLPVFGRVVDPDQLARIAQRSPQDAWAALVDGLLAGDRRHQDWPDVLAEQLRCQPALSLRQWAEETGLRAETVSRGFQLAYGSSPKAFRANARTRAALDHIRGTPLPLADIAAKLGFADQAHMSRAVTGLTGRMPRAWRAMNAPVAANMVRR